MPAVTHISQRHSPTPAQFPCSRVCYAPSVLSLKDDLNVGQVKDGINGYNFTDADSMYELLKKLRDMPKDELAEFGRRTRESIKTSGAIRLANDLLDVYKEAMEVYKKKNKKRKLKKRYRVIRHRYVKRSVTKTGKPI